MKSIVNVLVENCQLIDILLLILIIGNIYLLCLSEE